MTLTRSLKRSGGVNSWKPFPFLLYFAVSSNQILWTQPTPNGQCRHLASQSQSEEWLWSWEKSLKMTHLHHRNGGKMLQKYSLRRTRFEGGTSIPFCSHFQVEEGELEFHSPSVNHPSLREELSLLWWMNLAEGNRTDQTIPGTSRYMCPLDEFSANSGGKFTRTGKASAGGSRVCVALLWLSEWVYSKGRITRIPVQSHQIQAIPCNLVLSLNN